MMECKFNLSTATLFRRSNSRERDHYETSRKPEIGANVAIQTRRSKRKSDQGHDGDELAEHA